MRGTSLNFLGKVVLLLAWLLICLPASAAGPRYVTGQPFYTVKYGIPVVWSTATPLYYFTDPNDLSTYVNHQAAESLVAAAASVWNVSVASLTVLQGGALAEHVSGANVYLGSSGVVYPADVSSANSASKPIAVVYDTDGSVTDTLLGSGASQPSACRQNAVTESVDQFDPSGHILHAVLVLNGRCTGPAAEQQLQLQYQLMRAFGRILGLAWSQTNDNVFTGSPTPTYEQAQNWPIMHPIDILCGLYTYQCLPQPFTLRPDDIASLATMYPVTQDPPPTGKQLTLAQANGVQGLLEFPTGEGMAGVNVLFTRVNPDATAPEGWATASAVTGEFFRRTQTTPVATQEIGAADSQGGWDRYFQGDYQVGYLPVKSGYSYDTIITSTEPVNPLYIGSYALGPYPSGSVKPSGSPVLNTENLYGTGSVRGLVLVVPDAASLCSNDSDGTVGMPAPSPLSGWWNGLLCAYGHFSYTTLTTQPGRSFTLEVTALDETGAATTQKAMPVLGAWTSADSTGALPTMGSIVTAFNSPANGMSSLTVPTGQTTSFRLAIADQRGDGRPDFAYQARLFYADTLTPSIVSATGENITISGMGFRAGNVVRINGAQATVVSATSNSLIATVPSMTLARAKDGTAVDVVVSDLSTGAVSTMTGALTYSSSSGLPNTLKLISAPSGTIFTGSAASIPVSVQVLQSDGVTPVVGEPVVFSASQGSVTYGTCGSAICTVTTDSKGLASTSVTPTKAGTVVALATDKTLSVSATFAVIAPAGSMQLVSSPSGAVYVGDSAPASFAVRPLATDGKTPLSGRQITFSATSGAVTFDACVASTCVLTTDSTGLASTGVTPGAAGAITLQATDGSVSQTASFTAIINTPVMKIIGSPPSGGAIGTRTASFLIGLYQADGVTPLVDKAVVLTATPISGGTAAGVTFFVCNMNPCTTTTDGTGQAGTNFDLHVAGTYNIQAAYGSVVQSITIIVTPTPWILRVISAPSGDQVVGQVSPTSFEVQSLLPDGKTPVPGDTITFAAIPGQVLFGACPYPSCNLSADQNGYASMTITPLVLGPITLQAVRGQLIDLIQIIGVSNLDTMQLVSAPSGAIYSGQAAATPFAVSVTAAGQATPTPGKTVTFSITRGSGTFAACGQSTCTLVTDPNGIASSIVTPTSTGTVTVLAADGSVTQSASFTVTSTQDHLQLVSAPNGTVSVGQVASVPLAVRLLLYDSVTPDSGKQITLSVTKGSAILGACGASSCAVTTDANGDASTTIEPLAPGTIALLATNGSLSQTASFIAAATTPASSAWQVKVISGAGQSVTGGAAFQPVLAEVIDANGVSVAGAQVMIYETVTQQSSLCPTQGRCPAAQVLASIAISAISDAKGNVSITPLTVDGLPTATNIAVAAGTQGFATLILLRSP